MHVVRRAKEHSLLGRDSLGFARNVIAQATCHGANNRAIVDACLALNSRTRRRYGSQFPLNTSRMASISSTEFDSSFLSLVFSASSPLRRCASHTFVPPILTFNVSSLGAQKP